MGRSLRTTAYVVAACAWAFVPATAHAQVQAPVTPAGGTAVPIPAKLMASSPAKVAKLACASRCGTAGAVRPGSLLRLRGKTLSRADEVVFLGGEGLEDDVAAATSVRRKTSVDVRVPLGAAPGPVAVVDRDGAQSAPSTGGVAVEPVAPVPGPSVEVAVRAPRAYYDAVQPAAASYVVHAPGPVAAAIDVIRATDGAVIAHWDVPEVVPETVQRIAWDGTAGGVPQADGKYEFRVTVAGLAPASSRFEFFNDRFPILGRVKFGTGVAGFGGGRNHQGEDTFAKCGTPLVAARGGEVKYAGYHSAAGNYLVIDNQDADTDYAYMHLRDAPLVKTGQRVRTGQPIGFVGATGRATGCHLHFELWTAPGWYTGGKPIDPLPALKTWLSRG